MEDLFLNSPSEIRYCSDHDYIKAKFKEFILRTMTNNCNNNCFKTNYKLISDGNKCVLDCKSGGEYSFEYNT